MRRPNLGQYERLMIELADEDIPGYKNFMRMEAGMLAKFEERLTPRLQKKDTGWRSALAPGLKLAITLRYLASGDSTAVQCVLELPPHIRCFGRQTYCHPVSEEQWVNILQLQEVLLYSADGLG